MNSQNHREQMFSVTAHDLFRALEFERAIEHDILAAPPAPIAVAPMLQRPWQMAAAPVELFSPVALGSYHSPVEIIGSIRTAGDRLSIRLSDARGNVIARRALLMKPGRVDFFHTYLRFETFVEQNATLEISERSQDDGSEVEHVRLPLTILPGQRYLDLASPGVGAVLLGPVVVTGYSNTFEANVVVDLSYREGDSMIRQPTTGGSFGFYRDFQATFDIAPPAARAALISAYELDPGSGAAIDQTRLPVTILPADSIHRS